MEESVVIHAVRKFNTVSGRYSTDIIYILKDMNNAISCKYESNSQIYEHNQVESNELNVRHGSCNSAFLNYKGYVLKKPKNADGIFGVKFEYINMGGNIFNATMLFQINPRASFKTIRYGCDKKGIMLVTSKLKDLESVNTIISGRFDIFDCDSAIKLTKGLKLFYRKNYMNFNNNDTPIKVHLFENNRNKTENFNEIVISEVKEPVVNKLKFSGRRILR